MIPSRVITHIRNNHVLSTIILRCNYKTEQIVCGILQKPWQPKQGLLFYVSCELKPIARNLDPLSYSGHVRCTFCRLRGDAGVVLVISEEGEKFATV